MKKMKESYEQEIEELREKKDKEIVTVKGDMIRVEKMN